MSWDPTRGQLLLYHVGVSYVPEILARDNTLVRTWDGFGCSLAVQRDTVPFFGEL